MRLEQKYLQLNQEKELRGKEVNVVVWKHRGLVDYVKQKIETSVP